MVIIGVVAVHENREAGSISQVDEADSIEPIISNLASNRKFSDRVSSLVDSFRYAATSCISCVAFGKEIDSICSRVDYGCPDDTDEVGNVGTSDVALQKRGHDDSVEEVDSGLGIKSSDTVFAGSQEEDLLSAIDVRAGIHQWSPVPFLLGVIRFCPEHSKRSRIDHRGVHVVIRKIS